MVVTVVVTPEAAAEVMVVVRVGISDLGGRGGGEGGCYRGLIVEVKCNFAAQKI